MSDHSLYFAENHTNRRRQLPFSMFHMPSGVVRDTLPYEKKAELMRLHEFLSGTSDRPYRELIQHHIRNQSVHQMRDGVLGEMSLLSPELRPRALTFVDVLNSQLLFSQEFWKNSTCSDAVNIILTIANEHFSLSLPVPVEPTSMLGVDQELAFCLFQIATLSFAYTAGGQRKAREFIGIRKSLLFR